MTLDDFKTEVRPRSFVPYNPLVSAPCGMCLGQGVEPSTATTFYTACPVCRGSGLVYLRQGYVP